MPGPTRREASLIDCFKRTVDTYVSSTDYRNVLTKYGKAFGIGEWQGKVWHFPAGLMMHDLSLGVIEDFKTARAAEGLKPASINLEVKLLQRCYNLCKNQWQIEIDHAAKFKMLKTQPKTRFIKPEEEREVLIRLEARADFRCYRLAADILVFLVDSGVRLNEGLTAQANGVDLEAGTVEIWRSKTSQPAIVKMTKRMERVVRRRLLDGDKAVFCRYNRAVKYLRRVVDAVCNQDPLVNKRHGKTTLHSLRDTFASRLVQNDVPLYTVGQLLGHETLTCTKKYSHLENVKSSARAAAILDRIGVQSLT